MSLLYRIMIEKSITILHNFDFFMKVFSEFDSFTLVSYGEVTTFLQKKCRIYTQILHFIIDKYNFNKLLPFCVIPVRQKYSLFSFVV